MTPALHEALARTTTLTMPTLPMQPRPRDWRQVNEDIRAQARQVAEHFEAIAKLVNENAVTNAGKVPQRMVREYIFDAIMAAAEDLTAAVEISRQNAMEAA